MSSETLGTEFLNQIQDGLRQVTTRDPGPLTSDRLISDLGLDSLSLGELIFVLEEKLDISLEPEDFESIRTFGDLEAHISRIRGNNKG